VAADAQRLELQLPDELLELLVARAAEQAAEIISARPEPWVDVETAAQHLACPKSRVYSLVSAGRIPVARDGSRLLFRLSELDAWVRDGGGIRP